MGDGHFLSNIKVLPNAPVTTCRTERAAILPMTYPVDRSRRYHAQRLLDRRRRSREYEYAITTVGKERLVYLWDKLGYLDPWKPSTKLELKLVKLRLEVA